jgi:tRNA dimethylallyltransferase
MAAIGYKELFAYFDGKLSLEESILAIKQQSRRFAKRQMTWFKNKMMATWFTVDKSDFETTVQAVLDHLG